MKPYPSIPEYLVSKKGEIYSTRRNRIMKVHLDTYGYPRIELRCENKSVLRLVHRMVLETYVGIRPEGLVCRHLDGDKLNNQLNNLCWGTQSENGKDAWKHAREHGREGNTCKLTKFSVRQIRGLYKFGVKQQALAEAFGVSQSNVSDIVRRNIWKLC